MEIWSGSLNLGALISNWIVLNESRVIRKFSSFWLPNKITVHFKSNTLYHPDVKSEILGAWCHTWPHSHYLSDSIQVDEWENKSLTTYIAGSIGVELMIRW